MAVTFTEIFWNSEGRNLKKPDLACLRQDAETYNIMMFQPNHEFSYDNNGIRSADPDTTHKKFYSFFRLAMEQNVELAIAPEYSCPWSSLEKLIDDNIFPTQNNVWVVGCESIKPPELIQFIETKKDVEWIVDQALLTKALKITPEKFFDPVCMLLNTFNTNGEVRKVGIIQFKTSMFGGSGFQWERDHGIRGETIYVISNLFASIKLAVIICSDSLNNPFDFNYIQNGFFHNDPLLLLHIQLNQKPFQSAYKLYRNQLFSLGDKNYKKEVICLNWAWRIPESDDKFWNEYGGSGFYIKSDKLNLSDDRINSNHHKGLYYTRWDTAKAHIYFLNYGEHVFFVNTTKVSQSAANPTQYSRSGAELRRIYTWENNWVEQDKAPSDFIPLCESLEVTAGDLQSISQAVNYINVERIVALSAGNIEFVKEWYMPSHLKTMQIKDDEINNRITFTQDPANEQKEKREQLLLKYATLKNIILKNPANTNSRLQTAELKYDACNSPDDYLTNLHSVSDGNKGTGIYLGLQTPANAKAVWESTASLFIDYNLRANIFVWYDFGGQLHKIHGQAAMPKIVDNVSRSITSYKRRTE